jgi:hypothetical protein
MSSAETRDTVPAREKFHDYEHKTGYEGVSAETYQAPERKVWFQREKASRPQAQHYTPHCAHIDTSAHSDTWSSVDVLMPPTAPAHPH